ncbi:MAG TPA: GxxExxY protein [Acetobacteraceae bacterium]|nr:GxxExxY protein [Acetobacteraceae bacterium]
MLTGNALTERVIGLAIAVHRQLGPGLLESVYEECVCFELAEAALEFRRQVSVPVVYRGKFLEAGFRADIVVAHELILEIKSVEALGPMHEAQLLTYLRMSTYRIGLLMNFNVLRLKDGLRRFVM